ncbi:MAG TPA: EAL domain-containing protein [Steroidobacteraceae bacterium]|jgi:diguanylate cyclase (GGDEF)-like protein
MNDLDMNVDANADRRDSFEPYLQLVRTALPRSTTVAVFDAECQLRWSSDSSCGPELHDSIESAWLAAERNPTGPGLKRVLDGREPVYICWLRDDSDRLIGILAVVCRSSSEADGDFALTHALLRPAVECLRRDLLSRAAIDSLNRTVRSRDRDLEALLADGAREVSGPKGSDELNAILGQALAHVGATTAALIVPDKSIALLRSNAERPTDTQLVARARRQLLSMAQMRREPVIINKLAPDSVMGILPYKILSCALHSASGKTIGILALFREDMGRPFGERDARLASALARRATAAIEINYDYLSGLYTRPAFEQRVRAAVSDPKGLRWTALYIDVDQLHVINDSLGMHIGDSVLSRLGELIRQRLPPGAFAARISGDRFAVLLPTLLDDAERFAEALRAGAEHLATDRPSARLHVSISIGVALLDTAAGELMHSLAAAETACKAAKDRGRNRVEVYKANDVSLARRFADINIAGQLRSAIDADRLQLYSQLILPLSHSGESKPHYEILLRMLDEENRTIGPDRFLSAAHRYQLMPEIDRWVVRKAIEMLQPHRRTLAAKTVSFAINFSGQSLNDEDFCHFLLDQVRSSGIDPGVFCFELTENAAVSCMARAESLLRRLRELGCSVALDDFGTGLSSLSYLRQLPVTMLKIDGSFIREILKDPRTESMVRAIAQLARSMSIATVAEYVETDEIRTRLLSLGIDYAQGFAVGRPGALSDLLEELPLLVAAHLEDTAPTVIAEILPDQLEQYLH